MEGIKTTSSITKKEEDSLPPNRKTLIFKRYIKIPIFFLVKRLIVAFFVISLMFSSVQAPIRASSNKKRENLEEELAKVESQINAYENKIDSYQKKKRTLYNEIAKLKAQAYQITLKIKAIDLHLKNINGSISETQNEISNLENKISEKQKALTKIIQLIYENGNKNLVEILLASNSLSEFLNEMNNLMLFQNEIKIKLSEITDLKNNLNSQKEELGLEKQDLEALKKYRTYQKKQTEIFQNTKRKILKETKGKEYLYRILLKKKKETAASIRKRIFELLGGGELTFEQAYKLAKMASQATGVRAALILAILDRESALGKNIGQCNYKTAMNPKRDIPYFIKICKSLNINPETVKVSCPNQDGIYGGALGPAQFIPSTWEIYKDKVANITGHNPPSPFSNADAFVATALYLKDLGADKGSIFSERRAAARYYAGGRWRRYLWWYGDAVVDQAQKFEKDINILNSNK